MSLDIVGEDVEPAPAMGGSMDTSFILGLDKVGEAVKILLDIDKVLATDELIDIASAAHAVESSTESGATPPID